MTRGRRGPVRHILAACGGPARGYGITKDQKASACVTGGKDVDSAECRWPVVVCLP